jgi:hypothetical protein
MTCKEAIEMSNRIVEHEPVSVKDKIQLWYHNMVCKVCLHYHKQNKFITNLFSIKKEVPLLSDQEKEELKKNIEDKK